MRKERAECSRDEASVSIETARPSARLYSDKLSTDADDVRSAGQPAALDCSAYSDRAELETTVRRTDRMTGRRTSVERAAAADARPAAAAAARREAPRAAPA